MNSGYVIRMTVAALMVIPWGQVSAAPQMPASMEPASADARQQLARQQVARGNSVLAEPMVNVRFKGIALSAALAEIARQASVRIGYSPAVVPADHRVNVVAEDVGVSEAVRRVLAGTGVKISRMDDGSLLLFREHGSAVVTDGAIAGKVVNAKTKQPISGARILIGQSSIAATASSDGTFRVTIAEGTHQISIRAVGFVQQTREVAVTASGTISLEFALEPNASVLDEVVVTGTIVATERKAIATPITVITGEELERRGIVRIEQLFRGEVPGVFAFDQGSAVYSDNTLGAMQTAQVYARGASTLPRGTSANPSGTNPLKTYVDGVELLDASYLGTIDPASIERIEIVAGPQAATVYGSGAMGGVMQIFTKKGMNRAPDITLAMQYGLLQNNLSPNLASTQSHFANMTGGMGDRFSYSANLSYNYTGPWRPDLFSRQWGLSVGATHAAGPFTVAGNVSINTGENGTTSIPTRATAMHQNGELDGNRWQGATAVGPSQIRSRFGSQLLSLNVDHRPVSFWQQHLTIGRNQTEFRLRPDAPKFGEPKDTLFRMRGSNGQRTSIAYNMTFVSPTDRALSANMTMGMTGSSSSPVSTDGCLAASSSTTLVPCSTGTVRVTELPDKSYGGFGRLQVGLLNSLFLNLAIRGEHNRNYGQNHTIDWTPTTGLAYTFELGDISLKVLGAYGTATRAPNPNYRLDQYAEDNTAVPNRWKSVLANPDIRPERSRGPQGGFEVYYGNAGSLTFNYYRQDVVDLIQQLYIDSTLVKLFGFLDQWKQVSQYENVATMRQRGWEMTATANIQRFSFRGTYSWSDSRVREASPLAGEQFKPGQVFAIMPTSVVNLSVRYAYGKTNVNLSTNIAGRVIRAGSDGTVGIVAQEREWGRIKTYVDLGRQDISMLLGTHPTPGYAKSDLNAQHQIMPWASLMLQITNLGDSYGSESTLMYPTLGRQTRFGVSLRQR